MLYVQWQIGLGGKHHHVKWKISSAERNLRSQVIDWWTVIHIMRDMHQMYNDMITMTSIDLILFFFYKRHFFVHFFGSDIYLLLLLLWPPPFIIALAALRVIDDQTGRHHSLPGSELWCPFAAALKKKKADYV